MTLDDFGIRVMLASQMNFFILKVLEEFEKNDTNPPLKVWWNSPVKPSSAGLDAKPSSAEIL